MMRAVPCTVCVYSANLAALILKLYLHFVRRDIDRSGICHLASYEHDRKAVGFQQLANVVCLQSAPNSLLIKDVSASWNQSRRGVADDRARASYNNIWHYLSAPFLSFLPVSPNVVVSGVDLS